MASIPPRLWGLSGLSPLDAYRCVVRRLLRVFFALSLLIAAGCSVRAPENFEEAAGEPEEAETEAQLVDLEEHQQPQPPPELEPGTIAPPPSAPREAPTFCFFSASGTTIVDPNGVPVVLRGCNLGNWLLLETWMLDARGWRDEFHLTQVLTERFGQEAQEKLFDEYRHNWISDRDFSILKHFGFNVVRLPFHYRLLVDEQNPFQLRGNAFKWLDHAIALASNHGFYVILDMHGAPGGQSAEHTTGQAGQNRLWRDRQCQRQFVWLWSEIARHYKHNPVVAAYDLLNEPYGVATDQEYDVLVQLMADAVAAIREQGDDHMVFLPATQTGFGFYPQTLFKRWKNIGLTAHFYPNLFGDRDEIEGGGSRFVMYTVPALRRWLAQKGVPFLLGEFNTLCPPNEHAQKLAQFFEIFARERWWATLWSYKVFVAKGMSDRSIWGLVQNREPRSFPDLAQDSYAVIQSFFQWLGTCAYVTNDVLAEHLRVCPTNSAAEYGSVALSSEVDPPQDELSPWEIAEIGGSYPGGQRKLTPAEFDIWGGGADIWERRDQFRFVFRRVTFDFEISATLVEFAQTHDHAKAGLMLRASEAASAAFVLLHAFPNGRMYLAWREKDHAPVQQKQLGLARFPVKLHMKREQNYLQVDFRDAEGKLRKEARLSLSPALTGPALVGLAVLSHDPYRLARARFSDIQARL